MNDINAKCLEVFPEWLKSLGADVKVIQESLGVDGQSEEVRKQLAGGINYLFKSLDLVPDGIDDIGYLDDAFVLRLAAKGAVNSGLADMDGELKAQLEQLAADSGLVKELLGDDLFARFEKYCQALADGSARGRTVEEILSDAATAKEFAAETVNFIEEYETPGFSSDEKNIIKLKAFMDAKLPK